MSDLDARVTSIIDDIHRRTLRALRPFVFVSLAASAAVAISEVAHQRTTVWIVAQPVVVLVMAVAFLGVTSVRLLTTIAALGAIVFATTALFHFGPMLGTGLMFALAVIGIAYFFGRRAMLATIAYLSGLSLLAWWAATGGWSPATMPALVPTDWMRMTVATMIVLSAIGLLFDHVQRALRGAIENEVAAAIKTQSAEEARERALVAGMTSQRLETLGELAGGVAHDINNTLAVIQGTLELLPNASERERTELIGDAVKAVRSAAQTGRRLLGLARKSSEEVGSCEPNVVIEGLIATLQRVLPESLTVQVAAEPCGAARVSDAALEQIVLNLLINARDATGGRGHVDVACSRVGDRIAIRVADDGPGMTEEVRKRAFEPFFTTKPRGEGTGLGLALVRRLVDNAAGTLELTSAPGQGARFDLSFPVHTGTPSTAAVPAAAAVVATPGARVLVVEDDPGLVRMFGRMLRGAGYDGTIVSSVAEAKEALGRSVFDLLLTDGRLNDGTAADVIAVYFARRAGGPVIVCTGYIDDKGVLATVEAHASVQLVQKPFKTEELVRLIARLVEAGRTTAPLRDTEPVRLTEAGDLT